MKTCLICKKSKDPSEFALRGMASVCLKCINDEKITPKPKPPQKQPEKSPAEKQVNPAGKGMAPAEDDIFCPRCSVFFKARESGSVVQCTRCKLLIDLETGKIIANLDRKKIFPDPLIIRDRNPAPGEWRISEPSQGLVLCPDCEVVYPITLKHHNCIVACAKCSCEFKVPSPD